MCLLDSGITWLRFWPTLQEVIRSREATATFNLLCCIVKTTNQCIQYLHYSKISKHNALQAQSYEVNKIDFFTASWCLGGRSATSAGVLYFELQQLLLSDPSNLWLWFGCFSRAAVEPVLGWWAQARAGQRRSPHPHWESGGALRRLVRARHPAQQPPGPRDLLQCHRLPQVRSSFQHLLQLRQC